MASYQSNQTTHVGFVQEPSNGRGTFGLLWTCLATIFLSTVTVQHLNIPRKPLSNRQLLKKYAYWVSLTIMMPEFVAYRAVNEFMAAKQLVKKCRAQSGQSLSLKQAFYLSSGGLVLSVGRDSKAYRQDVRTYGLCTVDICQALLGNVQSWLNVPDKRAMWKLLIEDVPTDEMIDCHSKADVLTKLITVIQTTYFVSQVIARLASHMEISLLEVSTCGLVLTCLVTYAFWLRKPYRIACGQEIDGTPYDPLFEIMVTKEVDYDTAFSESRMYASKLVNCFAGYPGIQSRWHVLSFTVICLAFPAVHMAAWDYPFPSNTERLLWRMSTIYIGLGPLATCYIFRLMGPRGMEKFLKANGVRLVYPAVICVLTSVLLFYVFCRGFIIVETFMSLRSAPGGIYSSLNWPEYWPHVG